MKKFIIKLLLKLLQWLDWHPLLLPVEMPTFEINSPDLERIELRYDHEIKFPPESPNYLRYVDAAKWAIPHEMAKKVVDVIADNMEMIMIGQSAESYHPMIKTRMEIFIKKKKV